MSEEFYYVLPFWIFFSLFVIFGWVPEMGNIYGTKRSKEPKAYWSAILVYFFLTVAFTLYNYNVF